MQCRRSERERARKRGSKKKRESKIYMYRCMYILRDSCEVGAKCCEVFKLQVPNAHFVAALLELTAIEI